MRKILVVNMNYIGDALHTTPAIRALRTAHPDAQIDTVVGAGAPAEVLDGNPDLDSVIQRTARDSFGRCTQLYNLLRTERYDDVYILPPLPAYALAAYAARTPNRIGRSGRGMDRFLTRTSAAPGQYSHMADAMLDTVLAPGEARPADRRLVINLTDAERASAAALIAESGIDGRFVAVNVGATRPQKRWLAESFAKALDLLGDLSFAIVGAGPQDAETAAEVVRLCHVVRPVNLVDKTSLKVLAAVLERAELLLSADSGPMHLATAVGTPVLALFGSTDPRTTGPYDGVSQSIYKALACAPCFSHPTCSGRYDCMRAISADEVALALGNMVRSLRPGAQRPLPVVGGGTAVEKPRGDVAGAARVLTPDAAPQGAQAYRNILIVTKFRFMGDTLVATPILRAARQLWPDARITLLTGRSARMLLKNNPYLDEIVELDPNKADRGLGPFLRLVGRLRAGGYDLCLALNRSFHSALLPYFSGVTVRSGFESEGRGMLLTERVQYDRDKSEILCYFDILRSVAPAVTIDPRLELWVTDDERAAAMAVLTAGWGDRPLPARLIGIQPGASQDGKRWSYRRFAAVADQLAALEPDAAIVVVGGPDEVETANAMLDACEEATRSRVIACAGRCNLRESLGILTHLNLFIGCDTAVMHAAVALGIPTVALFGPTNAHKWGNYGECRRVIESPDGTMRGIDVDQVLDAVRNLL